MSYQSFLIMKFCVFYIHSIIFSKLYLKNGNDLCVNARPNLQEYCYDIADETWIATMAYVQLKAFKENMNLNWVIETRGPASMFPTSC